MGRNKYFEEAVKLIDEINGDVSLEKMLEIICERGNVSLDELFGETKEQRVSSFRQVIHYLLREQYGLKYKNIAEMTRRHHSSVIYSVERVEKFLNRKGRELDS